MLRQNLPILAAPRVGRAAEILSKHAVEVFYEGQARLPTGDSEGTM